MVDKTEEKVKESETVIEPGGDGLSLLGKESDKLSYTPEEEARVKEAKEEWKKSQALKAELQLGFVSIQARVLKVMSECSYIQKDSTVSMGGNRSYKAVSCDKLMRVLHPLFVKHEIVFHYNIEKWGTEDLPTEYGTTNRTWCEVQCRLEAVGVPIDTKSRGVTSRSAIIGKSLGYGHGNDDKGPGKAVTYAVKSWLLKTFALESGDDPDQESGEYDPPESKAKTEQPPADKKGSKVTRLESMAQLADGGIDEVKEYISKLMDGAEIKSVNQIPEYAMDEALAHFDKPVEE